MKVSITPIAGIFLLLSFTLASQASPETPEAGKQLVRSLQALEARLDSDYWVLIRNVTILGRSGKTLHKDMDVLIIGTLIYKIGNSPMLLFDKDLTYNFDGEGRIALSYTVKNQAQSPVETRIGLLEEGNPANIVLVETREMGELQILKTGSDWANLDGIAEQGKIRLIIENGVVTWDSLPFKRIDQSRLNNYRYSQ